MMKRGRPRRNALRCTEVAPSDFFDGVGVAVAMKSPVRTSVVVVVDTPPEPPEAPAIGVEVVPGPL